MDRDTESERNEAEGAQVRGERVSTGSVTKSHGGQLGGTAPAARPSTSRRGEIGLSLLG